MVTTSKKAKGLSNPSSVYLFWQFQSQLNGSLCLLRYSSSRRCSSDDGTFVRAKRFAIGLCLWFTALKGCFIAAFQCLIEE